MANAATRSGAPRRFYPIATGPLRPLSPTYARCDPDARWGWYINSEIVAGQITATGHVATREQAKAEVAKQWRRWLKLNSLPENHRPLYC